MGLRPALVRLRRTTCIRYATLALLCLGLATGCATLEHGLSVGDFAGRTLSCRSAEGAERLRTEIEVDTTLAAFVERHGRPDYLHVVDRMSLYLFWVQDDMVAKFERELIPPSTARRLGRIPGSLLDLLPRREVDALMARREREKTARARQQARRAASRRAAPAPAARSDRSYTLNSFDVRSVVERLRPPLTAADAGIGGWREVRFSDGRTGSTASVGGVRYELRADRLLLAMRMDASRATPPGSARLEVLRLNGAIFGAHARQVTEHVMPMLVRAAADRSGRTPMAQRVRGRLIRVDRVPSNGTLVYSIRP